MALYRQIAGSGMPTNQVGLTIAQMFEATREAIGPMVDPINYTTPIQTINPSQPVTTDSGTGWVNPLFSDPRAIDPNTIDPNTFPTPIPLPDGVNPIPQRPEVLPADNKTAITNNILPLLALAAVMVVAVKGDDLLHGNRKIAMLGGLGLLYYGMAKNKLV